MVAGDDDRLELGTRPLGDHADERDDRAVVLGHPDVAGPDAVEVLVEASARIVTADLGGVVDVAMPLGQLDPERPAGIEVGVAVAEDDHPPM